MNMDEMKNDTQNSETDVQAIIPGDDMKPTEQPPSTDKPRNIPKELPPIRFHNKGLIIGIIIAVVLLLAGAGVFVYFKVIKPKNDYAKANELLQAGSISEARDMFVALEDYEDSADKIMECDYISAKRLLDAGDYDNAKVSFEKLGGYSDSEDMMKECDYLKAMGVYRTGDYDTAQPMLEQLGDYKDAADKAKDCIYIPAVKAYKQGQYKEALEQIVQVYGYRESKAMVYNIFCQYAGQTFLDEATKATNAMSDYIQGQMQELRNFAYMAALGYGKDSWTLSSDDQNLKNMVAYGNNLVSIKNEYRKLFSKVYIDSLNDEVLNAADESFMEFYNDTQSVFTQSFAMYYFYDLTNGKSDNAKLTKLQNDVTDYKKKVDALKKNSEVKEDF